MLIAANQAVQVALTYPARFMADSGDSFITTGAAGAGLILFLIFGSIYIDKVFKIEGLVALIAIVLVAAGWLSFKQLYFG